MLEYDIDEAQALLEKNLSTATKNLDLLEEDLDFLRDQFTTTEVSILFIHGGEEMCLKANIQVTANFLMCFYLRLAASKFYSTCELNCPSNVVEYCVGRAKLEAGV